jgi:Zn-finger nucleic acid-binding protein
MTKFHTPANVELDSCEAHGVWLDSNELEVILRQQTQEQRSEGPSAFEGAGRTFVQSAVGGAGFGLVNALIRRLFN